MALICLGSGAMLDAATGPCEGKGSDEQTLLRGMLDTLEAYVSDFRRMRSGASVGSRT